jgi:hypothetical protein
MTADKTFAAKVPSGTRNFVWQLRRCDFTASVNAEGRPVIYDALKQNRPVPAVLLAFAKANRRAVIAFLQNEPTWADDAGDARCNECSHFVFPANIGPEGVATCLLKSSCPFAAVQAEEGGECEPVA